MFVTTEGSDPAVPLVFDTQVVGRAAFLIDAHGPKALVSRIDAGHLELHSPHLEVRSYARDYTEALEAWLRELAPRVVYLNYSEDDALCDGLTYGQYLNTERSIRRALPHARIESSAEHLTRVRSLKTPEELRRLQRAIDLTVELYARLTPRLRVGMTERQVQAEMNAIAAELGTRPDTGDFGGPLVLINRVGMSHRAPTDTPLEPGDLLILDTALEFEGYYSDIARTYYVLREGESGPPEREQAVFNAIYGAIDAAFAAVRPGVPGHTVDAAARQHLLGLGYPEIQHSTGHQIGRRVHDGGAMLGPQWDPARKAPRLPLEAGQVFTLEPTVLMTPLPSMIVEENLLVTEEGAVYLNPRQDHLWTV
ncbi:Xaa-Pro aminopeptidase [Deinobacterium chartae]|uniref:Xaa-Pro aminopeptidase n=1 Tax=Deinobacterium chartae TaxID=521158 RepID=A0A841HXX6_9DEIO|nr:Xaa-Pro peptidase family protein [Deinobacterium chartae]MBB6097079.1 Xaa-Pro aminopeptidase [Deinobacterium chartae]